MSECPECKSPDQFRYFKPAEAGGGYGPQLLPGLNASPFTMAKMEIVACSNCGLMRFYADLDSRRKMIESNRWLAVD